jgi:response regulator RpfG family c-di-GMP phosphodiesterase
MHAESSARFAVRPRTNTGFARSYLPQMLLATTIVLVIPVAAVWALRAVGIVSSPWLGLALAVTLSLAASFAGRAYWIRRVSGDVVFSDLMVWGWLRRARTERQVSRAIESLNQVGADSDTQDAAGRLRLLKQLAVALDAEDPYLDGHSRRVARYASGTARRMGLAREQVAVVRSAAAIHDVGKLHLPPEILRKPGRLTDEEFDVTKRHAEEGGKMVATLGYPELTEIVWHHHERFDGTGYPAGLAGAQIPLGARIVAVADTFDAITSTRPYRAAERHKAALDTLEKEAGTQLDPVAVRAFIEYYTGRRGVAVLWVMLMSSRFRSDVTSSDDGGCRWVSCRGRRHHELCWCGRAACAQTRTSECLSAASECLTGRRDGGRSGRALEFTRRWLTSKQRSRSGNKSARAGSSRDNKYRFQ